METLLLRTKYTIPKNTAGTVERPELEIELQAGLAKKLVLISAPPGFGKTTILLDWLKKRTREGEDICRAWYSLDESDNDLSRFMMYLISALQKSGVPIDDSLISMYRNPQPPPVETALIMLINQIGDMEDDYLDQGGTGSGGNLVLVLDDYHVIELKEIHEALNFFIKNMPENMTLVMATRSDPPLALAGLRAGGELLEVRSRNLRFTTDEIKDFFTTSMEISLSDGDLAALEERTEGWIAGLQMAAISLKDQSDMSAFIAGFTGSNRYIMDYLIEEIISHLPDRSRDFLLRTSILQRFNHELAGILTENGESRDVLSDLENDNLFLIQLDEDRWWYRYQYLFANLLQKILKDKMGNVIPELHKKAALWFKEHNLVNEALHHASLTGDTAFFVDCIEDYADLLYRNGEHSYLLSRISTLADDIVAESPRLSIYKGLMLLFTGNTDIAEVLLTRAETLLGGEVLSKEQKELAGMAAACRTMAANVKNDGAGILGYSKKALELLPEDSLIWRSTVLTMTAYAYLFMGNQTKAEDAFNQALAAAKAGDNVFSILLSLFNLSVIYRDQGYLSKVEEACKAQLRLVEEKGYAQLARTGGAYVVWGEVLCERNDIENGIAYIKKGCVLAEKDNNMALLGFSYLYLVHALIVEKEFDEAKEVLAKLEEMAAERRLPVWLLSPIATWKTVIQFREGDTRGAKESLETRGITVDTEANHGNEFELHILAHILIREKEYGQAFSMLEGVISQAEAAGRMIYALSSRVLLAVICWYKGEKDKALGYLETAMKQTKDEGHLRLYIEQEAPMEALLKYARSKKVMPEYTGAILAAFSDKDRAFHKKGEDPNLILIDPLSERELEVLRVLAGSMSLPEVADHLCIAYSTIRSHAKTIYRKLDVHGRLEAVNKAKELGLI